VACKEAVETGLVSAVLVEQRRGRNSQSHQLLQQLLVIILQHPLRHLPAPHRIIKDREPIQILAPLSALDVSEDDLMDRCGVVEAFLRKAGKP
jgi:hypothetical protein